MKTLKLLGVSLTVLIMVSCGSSSEKKEDNQKQETANSVYEDENLTVETGEGWDMKKGPNNHGFYTWTIESCGDAYKDIEDQYTEIPSEVEKVMVDGLPALTKLKTYQQNETIKERVWLIYNGNNLIQFSVSAPLANFDDAEAKKVIGWVKVKNRTESVELPSQKMNIYDKPKEFPEKMAGKLNVHLGNDPVLSKEKIEMAKNLNQKLNDLATDTTNLEVFKNKENTMVLDSLAQSCELKDWAQFESIVKIAGASVSDLLGFMADLEKMEEGTENYNLTLDATVQIINQTKVSFNDLRFVYDNWEFVSEFVMGLKEK